MVGDTNADGNAALFHATIAFVPERLSIAREAAGLTQKALAARIEVTASAISQFESGDAKPKAETISRLTLALGLPPGFFAEPLPSSLLSAESCHFRSRRKASKEEQKRVLARGNLMLLLANFLERFVEFPAQQIAGLRSHATSSDDIEELAERVREQWSLGQGPIGNMVSLVEGRGVFVLQVRGHTQNLDAFSAWCGSRPVIFVGTDKSSASRRRFNVGHELGHLLLHDDAEPGDKSNESEADRFASAFLLPRASFLRECPKRLSWPHFRALKKRWKVSLAALVRRAFELGVFTEATYRRAFVQINRLGWRQAEPDEPPMEDGNVLRRALEMLVARGVSLDRVATELRFSIGYLEGLLSGFSTQQNLSFSV